MKRCLNTILALAVGVIAGGSLANGKPAPPTQLPTSVEEATDPAELQRRLQALDSFESAFRQTIYSADGLELQDVEGHLSVTRRGEVRWQTAPPFEQLLVADGETIWLYDPDLEQVTVRPFRRNVAETPAMLLIGDTAQLADEYRIFVGEQREQFRVWQLVPRERGAMFERIELAFQGAIPTRMTLWDAMEQVTVIDFHDSRVNPELDADLFRFEAPPGTDILHDD